MNTQQAKPVRTAEGKELVDLQFRHFVKFKFYTQQYTQNQPVPVERWVNAISIKNAGNIILTVNGDPLQPGETKSIGGNAFEVLDEKHLIIAFTNPNGVLTPVSLAVITQKFYVGISSASSV